MQNKKIEGIADVRDESSREGMRIVVEIKRGEESQLILNNLFKQTQMQESFGMILLAIVGGQPRELGLIPLIKLFIEHRVEVVRRRTVFELRKAREREHILVGYQIALDHLDDVIRIIRGSSQPRGSQGKPAQVFHRAGRHHHGERQVQETRGRQAGRPEIQARRPGRGSWPRAARRSG